METLFKCDSESPVLLSNGEIMELLQDKIKARNDEEEELQKKRRRRPNYKESKKFQHRDWIESKVLEYLQSTPCTKLPSKTARTELQSKLVANKKKPGNITTGFGLTEAETLQILNFMPQEQVEIHLMIEELQSRMNETKQEQLIQVISSYCKDGGDNNDNDDDGNSNTNNAMVEANETTAAEAQDDNNEDEEMVDEDDVNDENINIQSHTAGIKVEQ